MKFSTQGKNIGLAEFSLIQNEYLCWSGEVISGVSLLVLGQENTDPK